MATFGPHDTLAHLCLTLAAALGPLAWVAARYPVCKLAPVTAAIVLLSSAGGAHSSFTLALDRVLEIIIGTIIGLGVALFVLPSRAHGAVLDAAARVTDLCADMLDVLLDPELTADARQGIPKRHAQLGAALRPLDTAAEEAQRERRTWLGDQRDPAPLVRTLTRIRHDLVMVSRATANQPASGNAAARRLYETQAGVRRQGVWFLRHAALALRTQGQPPAIEPVQAATQAYLDMVQTLRAEGVLRELARGVTGQIYTLSFAVEQLAQDLADLHARADEMRPPARMADKKPEGEVTAPTVTEAHPASGARTDQGAPPSA
ncbi:putative membrane protein YccC [Nitrospirillum iridis]|uniref:Putative membrane protein YccC n=1 Tax=Nitrospirillum iridis TaxID=765888 RepID=A0A7X0B448_9PROT|nr:FUSC family protein [Nitrospirillum iridis]MBB6255338.1 putative membrane protein YccC [Nitrospirillum iridis]